MKYWQSSMHPNDTLVIFSQLGKYFFLTGELFFPNWGKIIARLVAHNSCNRLIVNILFYSVFYC